MEIIHPDIDGPIDEYNSSTDNGIPSDNKFTSDDIPLCLHPIIEQQVDSGRLHVNDVDGKVIELLDQLDETDQVDCFEEFAGSDISRVVNKSAFLVNIIQRKIKTVDRKKSGRKSSNGTPLTRQDKMKNLCEQTGYQYSETPSYRRYGPPPGEEDSVPQEGEVYVGRIPITVDETVLIPIFSEIGKIYDLRYMLNPMDGVGRGYCFVQYYSRSDALKAAQTLNGRHVVKGCSLSVSLSRAYTKLFIGNIPRSKDSDELKVKFDQLVDGIKKVVVYEPSSIREDCKNRGYCFVHFDNQRNASVGKKKLGSSYIYGRNITVEWAEDRSDEDASALEKVKTLHIKGITSAISEDDIKDAFLPYGEVESVRKVLDYAFVAFASRDDARNAKEALNDQKIFGGAGGDKVRIEFARPFAAKERERRRRRSRSRLRNDYRSSGFSGSRRYGDSRRSDRLSGSFMPLGSSFYESSSFGGSSHSRHLRRRDISFRSRTPSPLYHNSVLHHHSRPNKLRNSLRGNDGSRGHHSPGMVDRLNNISPGQHSHTNNVHGGSSASATSRNRRGHQSNHRLSHSTAYYR